MKTAFVFPGQGVQSVGMGKDLYQQLPEARPFFDADETLRTVCFEGPVEVLNGTDWTQKAILACSCAIAAALENLGLHPDVCCGLSLGEYSALVSADRLSYSDALPLVAKRGALMAQAFEEGKHGMMAVLDPKREQILAIAEAMQQEGEPLWPANFNSPKQTVLSGSLEALEKAKARLKEAGISRCRMLAAAGAFHSPLLEETGTALRPYLDGAGFHPGTAEVIMNVTGMPESESNAPVEELLQQQICHPVQFEASLKALPEQGVERVVLIGPGRSLKSIVKACIPDVSLLEAADLEDVLAIAKEVDHV